MSKKWRSMRKKKQNIAYTTIESKIRTIARKRKSEQSSLLSEAKKWAYQKRIKHH